MQIIVDDLLTTYEKTGRGGVVLLLHGWGDTAAGLKGLQKDLSKNYEVLAINLPGFGGTQDPPNAWGLDDYAKFVAHFLNKQEIKKVYAVVGHSNGGAIAIRAIGKNIIEPSKLVLLASAGLRDAYESRRKTLKLITKAGKTLSAPLPKKAKQKLRQRVYDTIGSDMLVAEHLQQTFKKVVTDDVQADAAKITAPTMLIYGEDDAETPVWFGEKFHELIENSTLEILPSAGHFVQLDRPAEVAQAIGEFLK